MARKNGYYWTKCKENNYWTIDLCYENKWIMPDLTEKDDNYFEKIDEISVKERAERAERAAINYEPESKCNCNKPAVINRFIDNNMLKVFLQMAHDDMVKNKYTRFFQSNYILKYCLQEGYLHDMEIVGEENEVSVALTRLGTKKLKELSI